jgi:hypothetical protein
MPIKSSLDDYNENEFHIPTLIEMGYTESYKMTYPGGETEALRRMHQYVSSKPEYVCNFEKGRILSSDDKFSLVLVDVTDEKLLLKCVMLNLISCFMT